MVRLRHELRDLARSGGREISICVVRSGALGDTILTLPALQLLRAHLPGVRLTLVGSAWAEKLLPLVDFPLRVVRFDSPELTALFGRGAGRDPSGVLSGASAAVIYAARPDDELVSNARRLCTGPVVTWPVEPDGTTHAAVHFAAAVTAEPPPPELVPFPALRVPGGRMDEAAAWLASRLEAGERPVALHPGSGSRRKCWPPERFAGLMDALGAPVLLLQGPADEEACARVAALASPSGQLLRVVEPDLGRLAALLRLCRAYVGNDSGVSHLAAGLGVKSLVIFGPTDLRVWAPRGPAVRIAGPAPDASDPWPAVGAVLKLLS